MHEILIDHCKKNKIRFMTTAFDFESLEMISKYNLEIYKIPSGEINNRPYLQKIGSYNKKLILSTGASLIDEIKDALDILKSAGTNKENITVLHCNSAYPTPFSDVNLLAMKKLKLDLNVNVGYSDHSLGIEVPIAAVALGASVIEKHFTLDKNQAGPDHKCSLEPYELEEMVKSIRNIELSLGSEIKKISLSEKENIKIIRKSIVASKRIKKGDIFSEDNITVKRPGDGISPMKWEFVLGRISKKNFEKDQFIEL
jgi:N,N'-diacetyllegionaminate synthase